MKAILFTLILLSFKATAADTIVYGEGFSFSLSVPTGWVCDCDGKEARALGANVLLYKKGETWQTAKALIFIRVNTPKDDLPSKHLAFDEEAYKKHYPDAEIKELFLKHPKYSTASALFQRPSGTSEYVVFIVPVPFVERELSVAMNLQKGPADIDQIKAYSTVVSSVMWLGNKTEEVKEKSKKIQH